MFDEVNALMMRAAAASLELAAKLREARAACGEEEYARLLGCFGWVDRTAERYLEAIASWEAGGGPGNLSVEASLILSRINRPFVVEDNRPRQGELFALPPPAAGRGRGKRKKGG